MVRVGVLATRMIAFGGGVGRTQPGKLSQGLSG